MGREGEWGRIERFLGNNDGFGGHLRGFLGTAFGRGVLAGRRWDGWREIGLRERPVFHVVSP